MIMTEKMLSRRHFLGTAATAAAAAYGSTLQKADPTIKDSWEAFAEDIMAYGNYMSLKEPVYAFAKHSGEAFDWLSDHGLAAHHLENYAGHTHRRAHRQDSFKGRDYIECLVKQFAERKIEIHHSMPVTRFWILECFSMAWMTLLITAGADLLKFFGRRPSVAKLGNTAMGSMFLLFASKLALDA